MAVRGEEEDGCGGGRDGGQGAGDNNEVKIPNGDALLRGGQETHQSNVREVRGEEEDG